MNVSPADIAFVEGYMAKWFDLNGNVPPAEVDEWFGRGDLDFNLHNYGDGPLRVDAYEVVDGVIDTSYWVRVWTIGDWND